MKKTCWIVVAALAILAGCAGTRSLPAAEKLVAEEKGRDLDTLKRGRTLTVMECTACHRQYWPGEYTPKQWSKLARTMGGKAALGHDDRTALQRYLVAAAEAAEAETTTQ